MRCTYHLLGHHADRLEAEPPVAVVKKILQRRAEQVDDQDVVQAFLAKVIDIGNAGCRAWLDGKPLESRRRITHGSPPGSCTSDTRRAAEERRSSWVPVGKRARQPLSNERWR